MTTITFNFGIPTGTTGATGAQGPEGPVPTIAGVNTTIVPVDQSGQSQDATVTIS